MGVSGFFWRRTAAGNSVNALPLRLRYLKRLSRQNDSCMLRSRRALYERASLDSATCDAGSKTYRHTPFMSAPTPLAKRSTASGPMLVIPRRLRSRVSPLSVLFSNASSILFNVCSSPAGSSLTGETSFARSPFTAMATSYLPRALTGLEGDSATVFCERLRENWCEGKDGNVLFDCAELERRRDDPLRCNASVLTRRGARVGRGGGEGSTMVDEEEVWEEYDGMGEGPRDIVAVARAVGSCGCGTRDGRYRGRRR